MPTMFTKLRTPWIKLPALRALNSLFGEVASAIDDIEVPAGIIADAEIIVGTEANDVINVAVELQDAKGDAVEGLSGVVVFLSDSSAGADVVTTAPNGGVAAGSAGKVLAPLSAGKVLLMQTSSTGEFNFNITESGAKTLYVVVLLPCGKQIVSEAATFAGE